MCPVWWSRTLRKRRPYNPLNNAQVSATQVENRCKLCSSRDHSTDKCYLNKRSSASNAICQYCHQIAHDVDSCFQVKQILQQKVVCKFCNKIGHEASTCFKLRPTNSYNNTNKNDFRTGLQQRSQLHCSNCNISGHTTATCRRKNSVTCSYCKNPGHHTRHTV